MPGTLRYAGDGTLKFGPIVVEYGPKGMTTRFTVTCPLIGPLISYYNYVVTFGASGTFKGLDRSSDGTLSAETKELEVSLPGLVNNWNAIISELFFDYKRDDGLNLCKPVDCWKHRMDDGKRQRCFEHLF